MLYVQQEDTREHNDLLTRVVKLMPSKLDFMIYAHICTPESAKQEQSRWIDTGIWTCKLQQYLASKIYIGKQHMRTHGICGTSARTAEDDI